MDIYVNVDHQKLKIATNLRTLIAGSQQFIRFIFRLDEWDEDDLVVFAQFQQDGNAYNQYLDEENAVYLPAEIGPGTCTMVLYGTGGDNGDVHATSDSITLTINENMLVDDAITTEITKTLYDQLVTKVNNSAITADDAQSGQIPVADGNGSWAWGEVDTSIPTDGASSGQVPVADGNGGWSWSDVDIGISVDGASSGQVPVADGNGGWTWDDVSSGGMSADGASSGQVPVADGLGGWSWNNISGVDGEDIEIVEDYAGLLASTADRVLVLDSSGYQYSDGTKRASLFELNRYSDANGVGGTTYALQRNNGTYVFPMAGWGDTPAPNVPKQAMLAVLKTWLGNPEVFHASSSMPGSYGNSLFGTNVVRDSTSGKFVMDCSAFTSAVLLGISYPNSRYVLGTNADNIVSGYSPKWPSSARPGMPNGGLGSSETAMYYATQGRTFLLHETDAGANARMLQFGDILYGSSKNDPDGRNTYYNITHIMIVLGKIEGSDRVVCVDAHYSASKEFEQSGAEIICITPTRANGIRLFSRPNYYDIDNWKQPIIPRDDGTFTYNLPFFMPFSRVKRLIDTDISGPTGQALYHLYSLATEYLPVIHGSTIHYCGETIASDSRGNYTCRMHEYDENYQLIADTNILLNGNTTDKALEESTKFVRFTMAIPTGSALKIRLSDGDAFDVSIITDTSSSDEQTQVDTNPIIPSANAPAREIMGVIKSWVGRTDVVHTVGNDLTGMFSNNCVADSNGKYHMDCSDFVSAILLGITYENSRFVLGNSAENIENEFIRISKMPASWASAKTKGGLLTEEMAKWFEKQGRLFEVPRDKVEAVKMLRFGDILFGSNSANSTYYGIEHVMFVLGAYMSGTTAKIVLVECNSDLSVGQEGTVIRTKLVSLGDNSSYYRVFARPEYKMSLQDNTPFIPLVDGKYKYDPIFIPCTEIVLDNGDSAKAGHITTSSYMNSTPWYLSATPGSIIDYTGNVSSSRGNYLVRVTEYDENLNRVKRGQTMAYNGAKQPAITISQTTKYVAFTIGYPSSSGNLIWMSDSDNFEVTVTPPGTSSSSTNENSGSSPIIVDINGNGDFTSFTKAIYDTVDSGTDVYVMPGTYNIINEYKSLFGTTAVNNMKDSDESTFHGFQFGVRLRNRKIEFAPGAKLVCDRTGGTIDSTHRFSALAVEYNVEIIGLYLEATYLFYAIHDDYGLTDAPYTVKYKNCRVIASTLLNANCIGGGVQKYSRHIIENCYFDNGTNLGITVRYHNTNTAGAEPELYVSNCYFNTILSVRWYGTQTTKFRVYVNNCYATQIVKEQEAAGSDVDNVLLYKWNNTETATNQ